MAYNGPPSYGSPPGHGQPAPHYLPYRPASTQPEGQQQQHPPNPSQHSGAPHGFQPYQQPQHPPQQQAGYQQPLPPPQDPDGMVPAPLRLQRKPVAGPGLAHEAPPPAQAQHPQTGYFSHPTPSPSPYAAGPGTPHPPPQPQYHAFSYAPNASVPTPPAFHQWHGTQAHMAQGQPTPPALYEPDRPSTTAFIAELPGSEPVGHGGNQNALVSQPLQPADSAQGKPSPPGSAAAGEVAELGSVAGENAGPSSQSSKVEPAEGPQHNAGPAPAPTTADNEGLIPVEKPGPPDHEGLIPFHATDGQPAVKPSVSVQSSYTYDPSTPSIVPYMYPGPAASTSSPNSNSVASHVHQPQPSMQQSQPGYGGQAPFSPDTDTSATVPSSQATEHRPSSTSPYPQTSATPSNNSPGRPMSPPTYPPSNNSSLQQLPSAASPTASPYPPQAPTPAIQPPGGPSQTPTTPTPPPTSAQPSYHSATFPIAQSHSPSPTLQGVQVLMAGTPGPPASPNPHQLSFPSQPPQAPAAAIYTPAAFPAKPQMFPAQPSPSGPPHAGTFPVSQPSAIPSTPSVTPSHHSFSAPPQAPGSKPGKHAGASSSFGGFANSVFSKDTVKWSKKTASRLGGAIKSAASTAHAAAANAQTAAVQAAALHRQKSVLAAQMKAASSVAGAVQGAAPVPGSPQPQPPPGVQGQNWSTPGAPGAPGAPAPHSSQAGMPQGAGGFMHPSPHGHVPVPPTWSPAPPANGPVPQQGHFQMHPQPQLPPPSGYPQGTPGQVSQPPNPQQQPQPWQAGGSAGVSPGNFPGGPVPTPGAAPGAGPQSTPPPPLQAATFPPTGSHAPGGQYSQPQTGPPVPGPQMGPPGQFPPPHAQHQHSESWSSGVVAPSNTENTAGAPAADIGADRKPEQSAALKAPVEGASARAQEGQSPQVNNTPVQLPPHAAPGTGTEPSHENTSSGPVPLVGVGAGGQPGQPGQPQPGLPAHANPQGPEVKPPRPQADVSPGYSQQGQPAPACYNNAPSQPWPPEYTAPHNPNMVAPLPGPATQPVGSQPLHQPGWNPTSSAASPAPMPPGATGGRPVSWQPPQQQWGAGHGQAWSPQGLPAAQAPAPGFNATAPHVAGVPPAQPGVGYQGAQYGTHQPPLSHAAGQQPQPWAAPVPNAAPYPGTTPAQHVAAWQQPPPQWHGPAQQQAWGPAGAPQGMPAFPQASAQPQPMPQWNPPVQQPQPWPQPPGGNPSTSPPPQLAGPSQPYHPPTQPAQYPPQGVYAQGYSTVPPQPQWQAPSPNSQGPAFHPQAAPIPQNGTPQPVAPVGDEVPVPGQGASPSGSQQEVTSDPPAASVAATVGDTAAPTAAATDSGAQKGGDQSEHIRGESTAEQGEGDGSTTDGQKEAKTSTGGESNKTHGGETNGDNPVMESQLSQTADNQAGSLKDASGR